jgi:hypothetical protein
MNPERWKRIKEVFESALEIPAQERDAFLERACSGDRELQREVESLLAADAERGETIQSAISEEAMELAVGGEALVGQAPGSMAPDRSDRLRRHGDGLQSRA